MFSKNSLIIVFLIVIVINCNELIVNNEYFGNLNPLNPEFHFLKISQQSHYKNLIIILQGLSQGSQANVLQLYTTSDNNTQFDRINFTCSFFVSTICVLSESYLRDNLTLYMQISSPLICLYKLNAFYSGNNTLELNQESYFAMHDRQAEQVVFININEDHVVRNIILEFELLNPQEARGNLQAYINFRSNIIPSQDQYDLRLDEIGSGTGKGALNIDNQQVIKGAFVMLLIGFPNSIVVIRTYGYDNIRSIKPFDIVEDYVIEGNQKTFEITFLDQYTNGDFINQDLIFALIPYNGNPDMYVSQGYLPKNLEEYQWSSTEISEERIVVTPNQRNASKSPDSRIFYITIIGQGQRYVNFIVKAYPLIPESLYLAFNYPESGVLQPQEIINYHLILNNAKGENITIQCNKKQGNVYLYVKWCGFIKTNKCQILKEEILAIRKVNAEQNSTEQSYENQFLLSEQLYNDQTIIMKSNPIFCQNKINDQSSLNKPNNNNQNCAFVVAVYSDTQDSVSKYVLKATHENGILQLTENTITSDMVDDGSYNYYMYKLQNIDNVEKIIFQLTPIYGRVSMYAIYKEYQYPGKLYHQKSSFWNKIEFTDPLEGIYYLGIEGDSLAKYNLKVTVKRKQIDNQMTWTQLQLGEKQTFNIHKSCETVYFLFSAQIDQAIQEQSNLELILQPRTSDDSFTIYLVNSKEKVIPTQKNAQFIIEHNQLSLNQSQYKFDKFYGVVVQSNCTLQNSYNQQSQTQDQQYTLEYHFTGLVKQLLLDQSNQEKFLEKQIKYYSFQVLEINEFVLTWRINGLQQQGIQILISFNQSNTKPNLTNFDENITLYNPYIISREKMQKVCLNNLNYINFKQNQGCNIYFSIKSQQACSLTIQLVKANTTFQLTEGPSSSFQLPKSQKYMYFYFHLYKSTQVTFFEKGSYGLQLLANVIPGSQNPDYWVYPDISNYNFSSQKNSLSNNNQLKIPQKKLNQFNCTDTEFGCFILLSVYNDKSSNQYIDSFTLRVSTQVIILEKGVSETHFVNYNEYTYFKIFIPENDTQILIALSALDASDPDIVVSYGGSERPTYEQFDWIASIRGDDHLLIERQPNVDFKDKNNYAAKKINMTMRGEYIIGVTTKSQNGSLYQISYTTGNQLLFELNEGVPFAIRVQKNQSIYFQYYHGTKETMKILLSRDSGKVGVAISRNIPQYINSNYIKSNKELTNQDILYLENKDNQFCYNCTYFIEIYGEIDSKLKLIVGRKTASILLVSNQQIKNTVNYLEKTNYIFSHQGDFTINMLVQIGEIYLKIYETTPLAVNYNFIQQEENEQQHNTNSNKFQEQFLNNSNFMYKLFVEQDFYAPNKPNKKLWYNIEVQGKKESSQYAIMVLNKGETMTLRYGLPYYTTIFPQEKQMYNFNFYQATDGANNIITLIISFRNQNNILDMASQTFEQQFKPNITLNYREDKSSQIQKPQIKSIVSDKTITLIEIYGQSGIYEISIHNNKQQAMRLEYSIQINDVNIQLLHSSSPTYGKLQKSQEKLYEFYIDQPSIVLIEGFECQNGQTKLQATRNYNQIIHNVNASSNSYQDLQVSVLGDSKVKYLMFQTYQGFVYLSAKGLTDYSSKYRITINKYSIDMKVPYTYFFAGNSGLVEYKKKEQELFIEFQKIQCEDDCQNLQFDNLNYIYTIQIRSDVQDLNNNVDWCDNQQSDNIIDQFKVYYQTQHQELQNIQFVYPLNQIQNADQITVRVYGKVEIQEKNSNKIEEFIYPYSQPTIQKLQDLKIFDENQGQSLFGTIIEIILASLVIIAILFAIIYYKKYRIIEEKLNYELTDVRNVANIQSSDENMNQQLSQQRIKEARIEPYKQLMDEQNNVGNINIENKQQQQADIQIQQKENISKEDQKIINVENKD